jgi:predicted acyl esterase
MKRLCCAAALAALMVVGPALGQPATPPAAAAAPAPPTHQEVFMPMRDGVKLAANVFLPAGPGPWPVILERTPYLKDGRMGSGPAAERRYLEHGYAFVVQDVRGKGHSEGFYSAFSDDIPDGFDTVEWIARQPWSNGKVGITGGSALGITSNMAAIAAPPHLLAGYVIVAPQDRVDYEYPGGVLKEQDTVGWTKGQGETPEQVDRIYAGELDNVLARRNDMSQGLKFVRIPIFNVGGWYDIFDDGNIRNFVYLQNHGAAGARGNQKLYMGPFGHGPLSGGLAYPGVDNGFVASADELRWWDYWLKGVDTGIMDEPPVHILTEEPQHGARQLAAGEPRGPLLPGPRPWPFDRAAGCGGHTGQLPVRPRPSGPDGGWRQSHLRPRTDGPAGHRPAPGLPPLCNAAADRGRRDRRSGQGRGVGRHRWSGYGLHGQARRRLSRRLRGAGAR